MKKALKVLGGITAIALVLSLVGPIQTVSAAVNPPLGTAETYGILSGLFQHNAAGTTITGDPATPAAGVLGYSSDAGGGAVVVNNGVTNVFNPAYDQAGTDQNAALANLNAQNVPPCLSLGAGAVALDGIDIDGAGPLAPGEFIPGCYSSGGAMNVTVGTTVTLNGAGTYIFRPTGALNTAANTNISLINGASTCDVFWTPTGLTTLGANSTFSGTIIDAAGITVGDVTTVNGRLWAYGGTVTAATLAVNVPVCAAVVPPGGGVPILNSARMTINKIVIGGPLGVDDFPLFVNGTAFVSGDTPTFPAPATYTLTETAQANYTQSFTGDCDDNGTITLVPNDILRTCTLTNTYTAPVVVPPVPPLIDVVKVPNPLALPGGPGQVVYTYTLRNIGTVPVSNVTMTGDTCSPIVRVSGDLNNNSILEVSEIWTYTCTTTLTATHTNVVTATGFANGITATDIASATVVVGQSIIPPLINITKVPSPLTLGVGGGLVTYTMRVTNPGTVALSNVIVTDDKCVSVVYNFGDANGNSMLETTETWTYTCVSNLTRTTTNTATATGSANGFTATDFAIANVIVATAVPALPATGLLAGSVPMNLMLLAGALTVIAAALAFALRKRSN